MTAKQLFSKTMPFVWAKLLLGGAAVPAAKPVFCGQCGTKNEPGTRFCGNCGAALQ